MKQPFFQEAEEPSFEPCADAAAWVCTLDVTYTANTAAMEHTSKNITELGHFNQVVYTQTNV